MPTTDGMKRKRKMQADAKTLGITYDEATELSQGIANRIATELFRWYVLNPTARSYPWKRRRVERAISTAHKVIWDAMLMMATPELATEDHEGETTTKAAQ